MSSPFPERPRTRSSRLPRSNPKDGSLSAGEPVSTGEIESAFGPGNPIFTETTERLSRIFSQAGHIPPVAARLREWRRSWASVNGQEPPSGPAFIHQTYLALLARLIARRFVSPRPISGAEELQETINCDYFSRRGIGNFGAGDFFSWASIEPRWDLDLEERILETVQGLAEALAPYDFTRASPGIMDGLYRQTVPEPRSAPRWLAEYIVEEELGLAIDPDLSLLDPACGTGVFLSAAVGAISRSMMEQGSHPLDVLFGVTQRVLGMDRDPLAVALARLNYLLALGDIVQQEHPPFLLPVYLADAALVPSSHLQALEDGAVSVSTPAGEFPLPGPMVENPMMLDWVLGRLTNYMDGAQVRLHVQPEEEAVQEVMNAYYNYLTAQKPRTPVPEALTPKQADILLETARSLVKLHIRGEGSLWLHVVLNNAAPAVFTRRGSDLLAGSSHGHGTYFEMCSFLYLRRRGRAAMVMSSAEAAARSAGRRLVDLEAVSPGSALLVTGQQQRARLEPSGGPIAPDSSWAEAKTAVRVVADV